MAEEFLDEKVSKRGLVKKDRRSFLSIVFNMFIWIIVLIWAGICVFDYYQVYQKKEPSFCIKNEVNYYDDIEIKSCLGTGYKVYKYTGKNFTAIDFGPFWANDRYSSEKK